VVDLLQSPERAERIGRGGRTFVREHHDWRTIEEGILAHLADPRTASSHQAAGTAA
jgi:hypothetical protein